MRIESTEAKAIQKDPFDTPSWKAFCSQFPYEMTKEEKQKIMDHFVQHLSHIIHKQMKRMIDTYKKMERW